MRTKADEKHAFVMLALYAARHAGAAKARFVRHTAISPSARYRTCGKRQVRTAAPVKAGQDPVWLVLHRNRFW
jgi:hypothetical protein